jgi:hypothetical protein
MKPVLLCILLVCAARSAEHKVGVAKLDITPSEPIYLSGYAARSKPSQGVLQRIYAKALAIEDNRGGRVVIVSTDLIGLPRSISDVVAAQAQKLYGLDRSRVVMNSSHTHTGPMLLNNLNLLFEWKEEDMAVVRRYSEKVTKDMVTVIGAALQDLKPATLSFGNGSATFGANRRSVKGVPAGSGPSDNDVPVLRVTSPEGKIRAVLLGYACHNTTLTAEFLDISGDYAGFAQAAIEEQLPGATALFLELCGGDQNPKPRSTLELAQQHGKALAGEVVRVAKTSMAPVRGRVRTAFQIVDLRFAHHTREMYEARLKETNVYRVRHARFVLRSYDEGHPMRSYPYPVQAIAVGRDFALVALGGEVVIDYVLRVKKEYGAKGIIVAGYSNDVMGYIPSLRVLKEGGYEGGDSMIYYGPPGPWADDVEDSIFKAIHNVLNRVGKKTSGK